MQRSIVDDHLKHDELEAVTLGETAPYILALFLGVDRVDNDRRAQFQLLTGKRFGDEVGGYARLKALGEACANHGGLNRIYGKVGDAQPLREALGNRALAAAREP